LPRFRIDHLKKLLDKLDSPHLKIPVISVAGTNGKGSVCGFINSMLLEYSNKVGLYTSPHIFDFTERIRINNEQIRISEFKPVLKEVRRAQRQLSIELSEFELLTACAIIHFFQKGCEYCIMEVGLGGRLDATNVCENKLVSVVTQVSMEHTQYLGNSVEQIAAEKAGIIKDGRVVIDSSGVGTFRKKGIEKNCRVFSLGREFDAENIAPVENGYYTFDYKNCDSRIAGLRPGMRGAFQCRNAATAIAVLNALGKTDPEVIRKGIRTAKVSGRLEIFDLADDKKFIVDAAHNPGAVSSLEDFIRTWKPEKSRLHLIMGIYEDKDYQGMADILYPVIDRAWTITPDNERALDGRKLAEYFKDKGEFAQNFDRAYELALSRADRGDWALACGSFSVVEPALKKSPRAPL
jgi:dihydrofolate synthase/folylpolyglutamate synthase